MHIFQVVFYFFLLISS